MPFPIQRVRHRGIAPLELSDLRVSGATLWEWSQDPDLPFALRQALVILHAGQGVAGPRAPEPVPAGIKGFDAVFLAGGRLADSALRSQLSGLPFPVLFAGDPTHAGTRGGLEWFRTCARAGWAADLGNSQLKIAAPGRQWVFARDWTRLQPAGRVPPLQLPAQCRRLREFIAGGLQCAMAESAQSPQALLFAFPARVADDGIPSSSSYAGMSRDATLLPEAMELAGVPEMPVFVMNDAELAALGALSHEGLAAFRKVLVMTLGYGIGAALIHRSPGVDIQ
jgi:hypothetical protein